MIRLLTLKAFVHLTIQNFSIMCQSLWSWILYVFGLLHSRLGDLSNTFSLYKVCELNRTFQTIQIGLKNIEKSNYYLLKLDIFVCEKILNKTQQAYILLFSKTWGATKLNEWINKNQKLRPIFLKENTRINKARQIPVQSWENRRNVKKLQILASFDLN